MQHVYFIFYQYTALSSPAVHGHQMYSGGSVVCKASTIGPEIWPTSPLIFTWGQKVQNLASFSTSLNFEPPAFEKAGRYSNSETEVQCCGDRPMSSPRLVKLSPRIPEKPLSVVPHPAKIAWRKHANSSITQPPIIRFRSNYVQSLNAWHPKCCKS